MMLLPLTVCASVCGSAQACHTPAVETWLNVYLATIWKPETRISVNVNMPALPITAEQEYLPEQYEYVSGRATSCCTSQRVEQSAECYLCVLQMRMYSVRWSGFGPVPLQLLSLHTLHRTHLHNQDRTAPPLWPSSWHPLLM